MKKVNERAHLSSSEDEASTSILREAIDQEFLNDDLYSMEEARVIPSSVAQIDKLNKNSRRTSSKQEDKFTNFGVTAACQSFIAKKLDEILDRTIELEGNKTTNCCDEEKRKRSKKYGIKLMSTSKNLLTAAKVRENCAEQVKTSKRNRQIADDGDEDDLSKFREAAVDHKRILNKLDTKDWVNKRPEPEFRYKRLKNGNLIEM
ncbi:PREDICTED: uncharacterized protein LOC105567086 [Vollenhovia emeryi]|uniref:uncharacterized protein LOC105567086 n=1 Tax=Vollenhovia emeryi TaxID=411798 RepID=UPI0005F588C1|nr:PREDICTED: uncharacterized protein LOC105567086 [Vollenhovia emeryi]XP_011877040.1 PREDICTED: uncharacterized protein LOC105567086 [Vollenhovia emeryi]